MRKTHAFTLIELLVVISIIALLVAILLPALSQARKSAKTVQCASNIRQQSVALSAYTADYGAYLEGVISFAREPNAVMHWYQGQLKKYITGIEPTSFSKTMTGIFRCPSINEGLQKAVCLKAGGDNPYWNSYAINGFTVSGEDNPAVINSKSFGSWRGTVAYNPSQVKHPGQTLMFIDYLIWPEILWQSSWSSTLKPETIRYRHNDSANVGFADGHVNSLKHEEAQRIYDRDSSSPGEGLLSRSPPLRLVAAR